MGQWRHGYSGQRQGGCERIDYVHEQNAHIMISVWASFGPWTDMYRKMDSIGALYDFETWPRHAG